MKSLILLFLTTLTAAAQTTEVASSKDLQKWIGTQKEMNRAKTNDHVLLVVLTIKPTAKADFDSWVNDILYKALYQSKSEMKKAQLKATRWLEPLRQNADSTWTYSWIMDPVIPKTDYDILTFLKNEYGNEIGDKHWQTYLTFMARESIIVGLKQTDY
jgi:hypothetical protein